MSCFSLLESAPGVEGVLCEGGRVASPIVIVFTHVSFFFWIGQPLGGVIATRVNGNAVFFFSSVGGCFENLVGLAA